MQEVENTAPEFPLEWPPSVCVWREPVSPPTIAKLETNIALGRECVRLGRSAVDSCATAADAHAFFDRWVEFTRELGFEFDGFSVGSSVPTGQRAVLTALSSQWQSIFRGLARRSAPRTAPRSDSEFLFADSDGKPALPSADELARLEYALSELATRLREHATDRVETPNFVWIAAKKFVVGGADLNLSWRLLQYFWDRRQASFSDLTGPGGVFDFEVGDPAIHTALSRFRDDAPIRELGWTLKAGKGLVYKKFLTDESGVSGA